MKDLCTQIEKNESIARGIFRLRFPFDLERCEPGQFVMVGIPGDTTFLRRPFGIASCEGGAIEICYKVAGRGTKTLSELPVGTKIDVLGPCGTGFVIPKKGATPVLVAGGYGVAPLLALSHRLTKGGFDVRFYYGGKSSDDLFCVDELTAMGASVSLATEDGSAGEKGLVTDILERDLGGIDSPSLFSCGPKGLLESVAKTGLSRNIPTQVSTEKYMACGIGVCLGCVCKGASGDYVRTCKEGPVFDAKELEWNQNSK